MSAANVVPTQETYPKVSQVKTRIYELARYRNRHVPGVAADEPDG